MTSIYPKREGRADSISTHADIVMNGRTYDPAQLHEGFRSIGKFKPTFKQRVKRRLKKLTCFVFGHKLVGTKDWVYSRCTRCGHVENHYEIGGKL